MLSPRWSRLLGLAFKSLLDGVERFIALKTAIVDTAVLATPFTVNAKQAGYRELFSFINEQDDADIPSENLRLRDHQKSFSRTPVSRLETEGLESA